MNTTATTTLLPCPFCGAVPHTESVNFLSDDGSVTHVVSCHNPMCPAPATAFSDLSAEHAAAKWNTRNGGVA